MSDHQKSSALATAVLMDIIAEAQSLQAAVIRSATSGEIQAQRGKVHDLLDLYLDHTTSAATHVRAIIEP